MIKTLFAAAVVALSFAAPAGAAPVKAGDITIEGAWARATPKGSPVAAGYATIRNDGATPDKLTSVTADFANVEVHEMKMDKGVMQMRALPGGLEIPAHSTVALKPGGYHLMFTDLKHPLAKGETAKATFTFERAGAVAVELPVLGIGASGPGGAAKEMKGMKM